MIPALVLMLLVNSPSGDACTQVVSGRVVDARTNEPLGRARVEGGDGTIPVRTDEMGQYRVVGVCAGQVELRFLKSNYDLRSVKLTIAGDHTLDVRLYPIELHTDDEMHVQAPRLKATDTRSVAALEGEDLLRTRGESLADALSNLPGVNVLRNGTTAKPIVRGQYGSRVLKLYDGVRHEGQDWALDHGPEIDTFAAGSMKVVKGSAGVRYGPDAIAGVLLIDPPKLLKEPGVAVHTHTVGAYNGRRGTVAARLDGNHRSIPEVSWRIDGNYSRGAGLDTPDYPLDNTGVEESNLGGIIEYENSILTAKLSYRRNEKTNGVCLCVRNEATSDFEATLLRSRPVNSELYEADYEIERPFQYVMHETYLARLRLILPTVGEIESTYAFQLNDRAEYDIIRSAGNYPQFMFELQTHTLALSFKHLPIERKGLPRFEGELGVSGMIQDNYYRGLPLLSDYRSVGGGVFAIERLILGDLEIEGGIRYDHETRQAYIPENTYESLLREKRIEPSRCDPRENTARCESTFNATTVSLGGLLRFSESYVAKLDLSSATRMPTIDEQYISGTSPSFPIMARGLAELGPETSWSLSGTLEVDLSWVSAELSVYGNFINDYIYLSPELRDDGTVRTDVLINGRFPRFAYQAIDSIFHGADLNAKFRYQSVDLLLQGSVVRAFEVETQEFLLFIPSDRFRTELTYNLPEAGAIEEPYVSVNAQFVARQYNVSPDADFAPVPDGYILLGARMGTAFKVEQQRYTLGVEVQNALNTRYRDYTSMLRYYADEAGLQAFLRFGTEVSL
ncbi:MAG: TonB-dependent receptor [Bradymonadia bacterium]